MTERRILHCDMDCFYAAVHMRDDPALAGKPVVIGGRPEQRGVIAAASYEARRFGIHSAMPSSRALRLCPQAVFLPPDFKRYRRESEAIFAIYREVTPTVQTLSLDEAYLDLTGRLEPWGTATALARAIRRRVREERRLTVSVGVGPNRLVAKIASDFDKPDGLTVVPPPSVQGFLDPLPVRRLHGVGPATERALARARVDDRRRPARPTRCTTSLARFGRHGRTLFEFARGIDERPVEEHQESKSIGSENTYKADLADVGRWSASSSSGREEVAAALGRAELAALHGDHQGALRRLHHRHPLAHLPSPARRGRRPRRLRPDLLRRTEAADRPVRLLGVTASGPGARPPRPAVAVPVSRLRKVATVSGAAVDWARMRASAESSRTPLPLPGRPRPLLRGRRLPRRPLAAGAAGGDHPRPWRPRAAGDARPI